MLLAEFTPILTKQFMIPASGFVNASVYLLVTNSTPEEPRTVEFFLEMHTFRSPLRTISVEAGGSRMSIFPIELPTGEYAATIYAKADKEDRVAVASVTASVR